MTFAIATHHSGERMGAGAGLVALARGTAALARESLSGRSSFHRWTGWLECTLRAACWAGERGCLSERWRR